MRYQLFEIDPNFETSRADFKTLKVTKHETNIFSSRGSLIRVVTNLKCLSKWCNFFCNELEINVRLTDSSLGMSFTVKTLNIGTPRPATVVVLNIKQFNFTMT